MSKDWVQVATQSKCTSWNNKEDFEKKEKKKKKLYNRKTRVPYASSIFLKERKQIGWDLWAKIRWNDR